MNFEAARKLALAFPGVEEGTSYGTPAFRANGKLLARLKEDGTSLVVKIDTDARDALLEAEPETYYITDHYRGYPWILVRLPKVRPPRLRELFAAAHRESGSKPRKRPRSR